jgi:hypothetical protein
MPYSPRMGTEIQEVGGIVDLPTEIGIDVLFPAK